VTAPGRRTSCFLLGALLLLCVTGCYGRTEVGGRGSGDDGGDAVPDGSVASRDGDPIEPGGLVISLRGSDQPSRPVASSATIAIPSATR
jgi:hypothetical protein